MARFYTDEQFPFPVVELLRTLGHDVLTVQDAGNAALKYHGLEAILVGEWEYLVY